MSQVLRCGDHLGFDLRMAYMTVILVRTGSSGQVLSVVMEDWSLAGFSQCEQGRVWGLGEDHIPSVLGHSGAYLTTPDPYPSLLRREELKQPSPYPWHRRECTC